MTIIVCVTWGVALSAINPMAFLPERTIWMYFTIQSNMWIGLMSILGLLAMIGRFRPNRWFGVLHMVLTVAITLTGLVYCFMLAPLNGYEAYCASSLLTHIVVPLLAIIDYVLCVPQYNLHYSDMLYAYIPPMAYFLFTSLAFAMGWRFANGQIYPYYFLDWSSSVGAFGLSNEWPYMGVMYYFLAMLVVVCLISWCYTYLSRACNSRTGFCRKDSAPTTHNDSTYSFTKQPLV